MKRIITVAFLLTAAPAFAQQQQPADTETLQRAIKALYQQRNVAADAALDAEVRADKLAAERDKARAQIKEMESKQAKPSAPDDLPKSPLD